MDQLALLKKAAEELPAEIYVVDRPVDERGQYKLELSPKFPLAIKRLRFLASLSSRPLTWHTYLEILILVSGSCRVKMGDTVVHLRQGDLLVMDHLKLHAILDFPGPAAEAIVIRFLPGMALGVATSATDYLLLLPFYYQRDGDANILRCRDPDAPFVYQSLIRCFESYSLPPTTPYRQTGSRVYFLEVLHQLARHFQSAENLADKFAAQQENSNRLQRLFEHISTHYADRISLSQAASMVGLSKQRFNAVFKQATGMSLVSYLTHIRLAEAARRLRVTNESIADIAYGIGFSDQSYFDRRFRKQFGRTPRSFRQSVSEEKLLPQLPNKAASDPGPSDSRP